MPGAKQAWPNSAACWSPAMPAIGSCASNKPGARRAEDAAVVVDLGQQGLGHSEQPAELGVPALARMSNSDVRLALVASVAWTAPPVSRHSRKQSIVPQASSPRSARCPRAWRHYRGSRRSWSPRNRDRAAARFARGPAPRRPCAFRRAHSSAVRRSCQTIARWIGSPVARSQTTIVSRWLVMPMPATAARLDSRRAPRARRRACRSRSVRDRARPSRAPDNAA